VGSLIGTVVLDRYRIEEMLGKGAMGTVFRGVNLRLEQDVAIKVMHDDYVHDRKLFSRFRREAKLAAKMSHPNLIGVLDFGETKDGRPIMVLELAKGGTLTDLLGISPAPRRIIRIVHQILLGLEHAHAAGLIHRDLKPDNIMVELAEDGTEVPRIVDFGVATLRGGNEPDDGAGKLTDTGQIVGTPLYMAPEQAQGEAIDHRVDLFALGVVVWQMLAGTVPFSGSAVEIQLSYISKDPPPISIYNADVDPLLEAFALKLMARSLKKRFATATEAREVLELIQSEPREAKLRLGIADVDAALATIALRPPRK